jgi:hypothetical protein
MLENKKSRWAVEATSLSIGNGKRKPVLIPFYDNDMLPFLKKYIDIH